MTDQKEVQSTLALLATNPCVVRWEDFGDRGSPTYKPYNFATKADEIEEAQTLAAVRIAMPKFSDLHRTLAKSVADDVGCRWVTYPWLTQAASRILSGTTYEEIRQRAVR